MTTHQITVNILNDLTSRISGTTIPWVFEAIEVWVDGTVTAFSQTGDVISIPSYTSGNIRVESKLYILSSKLGQYLPKDPTNPGSAQVFWDSRAMRYPLIATSMKSIESGIVESRISTFSFMYRGDWEDLATLSPSFVNKDISIYRDGALLYSGISTGSGVSKGVFTVTLGTLETAIKGECTFGDEPYEVRIDTASNNSHYNGANIDEKWDGYAIPMLFGPRTPWNDVETQSVERGQLLPVSPPLALPPVTRQSRNVGSDIIVKIIPISATEGIIGRTPSFQSLASQYATTNITGGGTITMIFSKETAGTSSEPSSLIYGQLVSFSTASNRLTDQSGKLTNISSGVGIYQLSQEDLGTVGLNNYTDVQYDSKAHICTNKPASGFFESSSISLSSATTSNGNKFWKITATGLDFNEDEYFFVGTSVTGSKSAPEVSKFILESHGLTVDSSFATLGATYTEKATMQVGFDKEIQTVNEALAEINESLLTLIKKPLGGTDYSMQAIDIDPTPTVTVTNLEIGAVKVNEKSNSTYGAVQYEPLYLRGSRIRDQVYKYQTSDINNIYDTKRVKTLNHVLDQNLISRFDEITEYWARPRKDVGFILLDETIAIDIGDYVQVNHEDFTGTIMVTSLSPKQLGTAIQGIEL